MLALSLNCGESLGDFLHLAQEQAGSQVFLHEHWSYNKGNISKVMGRHLPSSFCYDTFSWSPSSPWLLYIPAYRRGSEGLQKAVSVTRTCSLDSFLSLASLEHCGLPFKSRTLWKKSKRKANSLESDGCLLMLPWWYTQHLGLSRLVLR